MTTEDSKIAAKLLENAVGMQTFDGLVHLCYWLMECANVPGDVVEFGCHRGNTAALLSKITDKRLWLYDSFTGLPEPSENERQANPTECFRGNMNAENWEAVLEMVSKYATGPVNIIKGMFSEIGQDQLPLNISFALIDGDLRQSTLDALNHVYPRLSPGAACFIDDYGHASWPGVRIAVDEFMKDKPERIVVPNAVIGTPCIRCYFIKTRC